MSGVVVVAGEGVEGRARTWLKQDRDSVGQSVGRRGWGQGQDSVGQSVGGQGRG